MNKTAMTIGTGLFLLVLSGAYAQTPGGMMGGQGSQMMESQQSTQRMGTQLMHQDMMREMSRMMLQTREMLRDMSDLMSGERLRDQSQMQEMARITEHLSQTLHTMSQHMEQGGMSAEEHERLRQQISDMQQEMERLQQHQDQ